MGTSDACVHSPLAAKELDWHQIEEKLRALGADIERVKYGVGYSCFYSYTPF